jgi:transcriptional regulator with XRE-family HTH domain
MKNASPDRQPRRKYDNAFLRRIRKSFDYNLDEVSNMVHMTKSKISRLERGETLLKPEDKEQFAAAFGTTTDELEQFDPRKHFQNHQEESEFFYNTGHLPDKAFEGYETALAAKDRHIAALEQQIIRLEQDLAYWRKKGA